MIEQPELGYVDVMRFLVRGLVVALATGLVAAVVALGLSQILPAEYAADARLLVAAPSQGLQDLIGTPQSITPLDSATYQELAGTEVVLLDSLRRLGNNRPILSSVEGLLRRMKVTTADGRNSSIITVTVRADDPNRASAEANAVAQSMVAWEQSRAANAISNAISAVTAQVDALTQEISQLESAVDVDDAAVARAEALRDSQRNLLLLLREDFGNAVAALGVFQLALGPAPQVAPKPALYAALAFVAGIVAAYGLLIVKRATDRRVRTLNELANIAGAPVLAALSRNKKSRRQRNGPPPLAFLAAKLTLLSKAEPNHFLIVGLTDGLDTTEFSLGLAHAFSRSGHRTMFVLSDLRRPIARLTGTSSDVQLEEPGFERFLVAPHNHHEPQLISVGTDTLAVVAPQKACSSPLGLLTQGFSGFLKHVEPSYDAIVVDAASALAAPDALIMTSEIPRIIVVVRFSNLRKDTLRIAFDGLAPVKGTIVGVVATDVPQEVSRTVI